MKKYLTIAAAVILISSCSNDTSTDNVVDNSAPVPIRLSSSLEFQTRAYTQTQETQIISNEKVYAWVDEVGVSEFISAWALTAQGDGTFTGDTYNYPSSGKNINVYAIHGNFATAPSGSFPSSLSHSVATDQTTGFAVSDLLCASGLSLPRQVAAHALTFKHLLSKIEVYLVSGTGSPDLSAATVKIKNTMPTTTVTLTKAATPATIGAASGSVTDISAKMTYSTTETVTVSSVSQNAPAFAEAIIVPQTVNDGASTPGEKDFIEVTIPGSPATVYTAKVNKTFDGGKRYAYYVVVNKSGITLTSSITAWTNATTTPEEIIARP